MSEKRRNIEENDEIGSVSSSSSTAWEVAAHESSLLSLTDRNKAEQRKHHEGNEDSVNDFNDVVDEDTEELEVNEDTTLSQKVRIPVHYLRCAMVARCGACLAYPSRKQSVAPPSPTRKSRARTTSSVGMGGLNANRKVPGSTFAATPQRQEFKLRKIASEMHGPSMAGHAWSAPRYRSRMNASLKSARSLRNRSSTNPGGVEEDDVSSGSESMTTPTNPRTNCDYHRAIMWISVLQSHEYVKQEEYDTIFSSIMYLTEEFDRKLEQTFPKMAEISHDELESVASKIRQRILGPYMQNKSSQIIQSEVNSSFDFDVADSWTPLERVKMQFQLSLVCHIFFTAVNQTDIPTHYYQGLNKIASVLLLILGPTDTIFALARLSADHLRGFTDATMIFTSLVNKFCLELVRTQDRKLYDHLCEPNMDPIFAVPWYLTWLAHPIRNFSAICEVFDVLLVSSPLFCVYLAASVVLLKKQEIISISSDTGKMQTVLQDSLKDVRHQEVNEVIVNAIKLYQSVDPQSVPFPSEPEDMHISAWSEVSSFPKFWMTRYTRVYILRSENSEAVLAKSDVNGSLKCLGNLLYTIYQRRPVFGALNVQDPLLVALPSSNMCMLAVKDIPCDVVDSSIRGGTEISWNELISFHEHAPYKGFDKWTCPDGFDHDKPTCSDIFRGYMVNVCWNLGYGTFVVTAGLAFYIFLTLIILLISGYPEREVPYGHRTLRACSHDCEMEWGCVARCCLQSLLTPLDVDL